MRTEGQTDGQKDMMKFFEILRTRLKKREIIWLTRYNKVISVKETAFEIIIIRGNKQRNNGLRSEKYLFYSDK
jgi:hypothetical protein